MRIKDRQTEAVRAAASPAADSGTTSGGRHLRRHGRGNHFHHRRLRCSVAVGERQLHGQLRLRLGRGLGDGVVARIHRRREQPFPVAGTRGAGARARRTAGELELEESAVVLDLALRGLWLGAGRVVVGVAVVAGSTLGVLSPADQRRCGRATAVAGRVADTAAAQPTAATSSPPRPAREKAGRRVPADHQAPASSARGARRAPAASWNADFGFCRRSLARGRRRRARRSAAASIQNE